MKTGILSELKGALESLQPRIGKVYSGGKQVKNPSVLDWLTTSHGDYGLTIAYAGLFAPEIWMKDGIPFARFSPDDSTGMAISVFHVDLLGH